jgi:glycosyltransferase involved in cell wall biosynthesis
MRVLQIHKFFYPHAGSETVLFHTRELLQSRGHEIVDFAMEDPRNVESPYAEFFAPRREYTDPGRPARARVTDALASVYSTAARAQLRRLLSHVRPDVAHMHVIYHQLTLSIVDELHKSGIPMVLTLHDYKIGCPAHVLYRDGHPCRLCTTGRVENVLLHKCIKGSRPASLLAAAEARLARQRNSYDKIDVFVAPSAFAGRVAVETGIPDDRVHVVPNFLPHGELEGSSAQLDPTPRFFFAGRLETVKGVRDLLDVFAGQDPELGTLVLAGAGGELEDNVRATAQANDNIEYLGRVTREEVLAQLRRSRAALVPSRWDENYPMSLLEARACRIPIITTDRGGLPEMVDDGVDGFVVAPGDVQGLRAAVRRLAADIALARSMGSAGHERLQRVNSPEAHYEGLLGAYGHAQDRVAARTAPHAAAARRAPASESLR